jgi:hypothetical protein
MRAPAMAYTSLLWDLIIAIDDSIGGFYVKQQQQLVSCMGCLQPLTLLLCLVSYAADT